MLEEAAVAQAGERVVLGQVAQALLHQPPFGDVLDLGDQVQRLALQVAHQRNRERGGDDVPLGVEEALFDLVVADLPHQQALDVLHVHRQVVGVGDLLGGLREQFLGAVAGDLQERLVDAHPAAVGREQGDADRRLLEDELKALLGVAAGLLGVLARGDLGEHRGAAHDRRVLIAQRADLQLIAVRLTGRPHLQCARLAAERRQKERLIGLPALPHQCLAGQATLKRRGLKTVVLERLAGGQDDAQLLVKDDRGQREGAQQRQRDTLGAQVAHRMALQYRHLLVSAFGERSLTGYSAASSGTSCAISLGLKLAK